MQQKTIMLGRIVGPVAFVLILALFRPSNLDVKGTAVLASTAWIAIWWITEAIPMAATALLPMILFPMTGAVSLQETTTQYGHRYIFLYVGGFLIAIGIEKWGLHRRMALNIIRCLGTDVRRIILGFMVATGFLSMWISNTATTVLMLPIGMAIVSQRKDHPETVVNENEVFGKALMLAIAYSATIGGMATLIGTPPNLVLAGVIEELYQTEISFAKWMMFALPISVLLLIVCWIYLTRVVFIFRQADFPGGRKEIAQQISELGKLSFEEKCLLAVFLCAAVSWVGRSFVQQQLGILLQLDDTIIAMVFALSLFVIPVRTAGHQRQEEATLANTLLTWEDTQKLPWGIVLLFGGGMALAEGFKTSGLAEWIGNQASLLHSLPLFVLLLILVAAVNFLTEVTSNLATTSMLLPVLASMATAMHVHPFLFMIGATLAASCAFMLPVATPPNAVVFGSGYLRIPDMVRCGLRLNLFSIVLVTMFVYFVLPIVWQIDWNAFPEAWR
ncbi:MAG: SLC13/DASS family transporter [Planctomycetales bacterium]|nr:SLC13/DASS family transporter [Planctomycetales bacterium]